GPAFIAVWRVPSGEGGGGGTGPPGAVREGGPREGPHAGRKEVPREGLGRGKARAFFAPNRGEPLIREGPGTPDHPSRSSGTALMMMGGGSFLTGCAEALISTCAAARFASNCSSGMVLTPAGRWVRAVRR